MVFLKLLSSKVCRNSAYLANFSMQQERKNSRGQLIRQMSLLTFPKVHCAHFPPYCSKPLKNNHALEDRIRKVAVAQSMCGLVCSRCRMYWCSWVMRRSLYLLPGFPWFSNCGLSRGYSFWRSSGWLYRWFSRVFSCKGTVWYCLKEQRNHEWSG